MQNQGQYQSEAVKSLQNICKFMLRQMQNICKCFVNLHTNLQF